MVVVVTSRIATCVAQAVARDRWPSTLFTCEQLIGVLGRYAQGEDIIMSASHHPTDMRLRQHRTKKRSKLRARIAAAPTAGHAALEAKVQRTYSPFHRPAKEKLPLVVA